MTTEARTYHSTGELIAETIRPIAQAYRETVNDIAREALELTDEEERDTFVWESVDGIDWVIYYQNARAVAMVTPGSDVNIGRTTSCRRRSGASPKTRSSI